MKTDVVKLLDEPFCAETRLELQDDLLTPTSRFYARNNFPFPEGWPGIAIDGAVERPQSLALADLRRLPSRGLVATLECAGNGRAFMSPTVPGEQWRLGAVSTADWRGVSLTQVLGAVGVRPDTVEVQFSGSDGFARSLPIEIALAPETMLVLGMNGRDLPLDHGGPVRLLVPGWYGMSAVKWLARITALTKPFRGHYQVERYVIDGRPVREVGVRSVITAPAADATVGARFKVHGLAWTGLGVVAGVDVSADGAESWSHATFLDVPTRFAWLRWECDLYARPGAIDLVCRAADSAGRVQPLDPIWNALGYCNNASVRVPINVASPPH